MKPRWNPRPKPRPRRKHPRSRRRSDYLPTGRIREPDVPPAWTIQPARPDELRAAFRLAFRHLGEDDRDARVINALAMLRDGELDADGVIVARAAGQLLGALVCLPVPGASGL